MMKKLSLIFLIILPLFSFAQYNKSSKFLYGASRSKLPYYIGAQVGVATNDFSGNKDFINNGSAFSWGLSFEKPLGYRPSLIINFRTMGKYTSTVLNQDPISPQVVTSSLKKSYDLSINFNYLLFDWYGWQYKSSVGIGFVNNKSSLNNYTINETESTSAVIPFQISTGRVIKKRIELEFGYRYYLALDNQIEGASTKNKYDKYTFAFVGLKYLIGEKDYRFQKKGDCPSVE